MSFIADLHIHSRFSRATSKQLTPAHLAAWARCKGIDLLGTGDFTHPQWREELRAQLVEDADSGLYRLRQGMAETPAFLSLSVNAKAACLPASSSPAAYTPSGGSSGMRLPVFSSTSSIRSMPLPKPTAGTEGPPKFSIRVSYLPPPSTVPCEPMAVDTNSKTVLE